MHYLPKDLFQLQSELVEAKVNIAVNDTIDRVVMQIHSLRDEMHDMRLEMNTRFSSLESRITAVETKLGMTHELRRDIRTRLLDYIFKAGWLVLAYIGAYLLYLGLHHFS